MSKSGLFEFAADVPRQGLWGDIVGGLVAKGRAKVSGFWSEAPHEAGRSEKSQSLSVPNDWFLLTVRLARPGRIALGAA